MKLRYIEQDQNGDWKITQLVDDIQQVSAEVPSGKQDQIDQVKVHAQGKDVIKGTNKKPPHYK